MNLQEFTLDFVKVLFNKELAQDVVAQERKRQGAKAKKFPDRSPNREMASVLCWSFVTTRGVGLDVFVRWQRFYVEVYCVATTPSPFEGIRSRARVRDLKTLAKRSVQQENMAEGDFVDEPAWYERSHFGSVCAF